MDEPIMRTIDVEPGTVHNLVVLDPIEPCIEPEYCLHGKATCVRCGDWVWLGHATHEVVSNGEALPLCIACADKYLAGGGYSPTRHIEDHRRADGPHE